MKKIWSGLCATTLAFSFAAATMAPAAAAPVFVPKAVSAESAAVIEQVNHRRWERRMERREFRRDRREVRRAIRDLERRGDWWYYNGHRGYRERRPGYRLYNGFWFPAAAFLAGALVTGAIIDEPDVVVVRRGRSAHVDWCYNRYRSYRASDNSFQPYAQGGYLPPREQCYSPYD